MSFLLQIVMIVSGNLHQNVIKFTSVNSGDLDEGFPGLSSPALQVQPGQRLWDPTEHLTRELTDVPHTTDLLSRMTGSTKAVVGMASWDQWDIREERRGVEMEARQ